MSRCTRYLLSSAGRWQLMMTSSPPSANQQLLSHHHRCSANRSRVLPGAVSPMLLSSSSSDQLLHGLGRQHLEAGSSSSHGIDDEASLVGSTGDGMEASVTDDASPQRPMGRDGAESRLADLDLGKTFIPPSSTDNLVFGGIPYYQLPIIHIKATYNNTHINITDHTRRRSYTRTTCGAEGFKNAKKGTTIAAQTVGIAAAAKATDKGLKMVRVVVKGIGPGRQASIKGLQMGGLDIVSITDDTPVPHNGSRPRKAKRR